MTASNSHYLSFISLPMLHQTLNLLQLQITVEFKNIMKESTCDDSLTFSRALMNLKCSSITTAQSQKSIIDEPIRYQSPNHKEFSSLKPQLLQRTNITLKSIFHQYLINANNQYVLKLQKPKQSQKSPRRFDEWINGMFPQTITKGSYHTNIEINLQQALSQRRKEELKTQIAKNVQRFAHQLSIESNHTASPKQEENQLGNRQKCKYSFSGYFNEEDCWLQRPVVQAGEVVTKLSIAAQLQDQYYPSLDKEKKSQNKGQRKNEEQEDGNKQNININSKGSPQVAGGLQFSKNRRFKSTKKTRKGPK